MNPEAVRALEDVAEELRSALVELLDYEETWPRIDRGREAVAAYDAWRTARLSDQQNAENSEDNQL